MTEESDEKKLLNSIFGYVDLFVISYTPAFLPTKIAKEKQIKADYRGEILRRVKAKKDTTIYMAEEGLKRISGLSIEERKDTLKNWEGLTRKIKEPNLKIMVYRSGGLPCTSLIIGTLKMSDTDRFIYDVFLEYRINYLKEFNGSTPRSYSENKMIFFYQDSLPDEIKEIKERMEQVERETFKDWLMQNKEKGEFIIPDPNIGIISALDRELRHYQYKYEEYYHSKLATKNRGRYLGSGSNEGLELIFAEKSYGREKALLSTIELAKQFESLKSFIFLGIAGGVPRPLPENAGEMAKRNLDLYDIVISSEIIDLVYERICGKDLCNVPSNEKQLVRLNEETNLIFKYDTHKVSEPLKVVATNFEKYTNQHPDEWVKFVRKYFNDIKANTIHDSKFRDEISNRINKIKPRVVVGKIFSSDHNVNFEPLRDGLANLGDFKDLYAFEMEGSGLAHGASSFGRDFIEIRGISDMCAGKRPEDEDKVNQTVAAVVASAALDKFLEFVYKNSSNGELEDES